MSAQFRAHLAFHVAGARTDGEAEAVAGRALRPALLARRADLSSLRHDFPLVLVDGDEGAVRSVSSLADDVLRTLAPPGSAGERMRQLVLRVERELRRAIASGATGTLSAQWALAAARVASGDRGAAAELAKARAALGVDGELLDCGAGVGVRLVAHLWRAAQRTRVRRLHSLTHRLRLRLGDILRAHHLASPAGRSAETLAASFASGDRDVIDFGAMSKLLTRTAAVPMPEARARRIREALAALDSHELFPDENGAALGGFVFDGAAAAAEAHRVRLPLMRRLARAIAVAQLEVEGLYVEARHDRLLERLFERELRPGDRALFPDELVIVEAATAARGEGARLLELLSGGSTAKVIVELDDLASRGTLGVRADRLAAMAMGLGDVHVVQAPAAALYPLVDRLASAIAGDRAALVSIFSGATPHADLPPFLLAGAALTGRSFPVFSFDPDAGDDWASRFSLAGNPQPERAWPLHSLEYADAAEQRVTVDVAFTHADFVACDRRQGAHLAAVTRGAADDLAPVADVVAGGAREVRVPYVLMADADGNVARVIVDEPLMAETRAVAAAWKGLQELAGIGNSHVARALERERLAWAERAPAPVIAAEAPLPTVPVAAAADAALARADGEPYIETARCSTCNECTRLNDRMFAYDGNKQAFIKDVSAGTFAQLVAAAESCQLSIIHPGKPRNPKEPNLDELIARAQPFQ